MAGKSPGDTSYPIGSRLPPFMTNARNDGITRVLLLRAKPLPEPSPGSQHELNQQNLPSNPFLIARSIEAAIGYNNRMLVSANREARGTRYVLRTQSPLAYRELLKMTNLTDACKTEVEVIDHPTLNFVQGVVFDHDTVGLDEAELLEELKPEGVTCVRRITKKQADGKFKNTPLIILTFRGTQRPEHIRFGLLKVNVRPYYPSVLICRNCAAYGHPSKRCTSSAACMNCSQKHLTEENQTCPNPSFCSHCSGAHSPVSKDCPIFRKEEAVIRLRVDRGLSYVEAKAEIEQCTSKPTYASKLQHRLDQHSDKDREIQLLRDELKKIREQMTDYLAMKKELEYLKKRQDDKTLSQETSGEKASAISIHQNVTSNPRLSRVDSGKGQVRKAYEQGAAKSHQLSPKQSRTEVHRSLSRKRFMKNPPTPNDQIKRQNQTNVSKEINIYDLDDDDFDIS